PSPTAIYTLSLHDALPIFWTEGFDYNEVNNRLTPLMNGAANWREAAQGLGVRYIFWGQDEKTNYQTSTRPWEATAFLVASGDWGDRKSTRLNSSHVEISYA